MAALSSFPCASRSTNYRGLSAALSAMVEAGHDPGPRGPQIRSLGLALGALLPQLRDLALPPEVQADTMAALIARVEQLSLLASVYGGDLTQA